MRQFSHAPLAARTTLGVGGPARRLIEAHDEREIVSFALEVHRRGELLVVLGGGSNVVVADGGVRATVLAPRNRGVALRSAAGDAVEVEVQAGEPFDALVARAVAEGLAGIACLSGIPGLCGATPIQNVGAYGQSLSDVLVAVRALDLARGDVVEIGARDCALGYRTSRFKGADRGRFVILSLRLRLRRSPPRRPRYGDIDAALPPGRPSLAAIREAVLAVRRRKGMVVDPADPESRSAGSFFLNPVVDEVTAAGAAARARALGRSPAAGEMPRYPAGPGRVKLAAAWLVEAAGFRRGERLGRAALSRRHALAIVNRGGATAAEIVALAARVQRGVRARLGVELTPEPALVGFADAEPGGLAGGRRDP